MMMALMLTCIGAWAGGDVTVVPAEGGAVEASEAAAGETCTLTVTPAHGYYLKALTATTTLDGGALQAPGRRASDIAIDGGESLEITPVNPDADPSGVTTHTFKMPADDYNVEVKAEFAKSDFMVNGKVITPADYNKALFDGTVTFSPAVDDTPAMLTLNGAKLTKPVVSCLPALTIKLIGDNSIVCEDSATTINSYNVEASLTIVKDGESASLLLSNYGVVIKTFTSVDYSGFSISEHLPGIVQNSYTYDGVATYYAHVGGAEVNKLLISTDGALVEWGLGRSSVSLADNVLTLNSADIGSADGWTVQMGENVTSLDVMLAGENTIAGNGFYFAENPAALTFKTNAAEPGSLMISADGSQFAACADGMPVVYCENGLVYNETGRTVRVEDYGLKVGGVAVTSQNMTDVLGNGTVAFTPATDESPSLLTLKNATIDMSLAGGYPVESSIANLTVLLKGHNTFACGNAAYAFRFATQGTDATLTFAKDEKPGEGGFGMLTVMGTDLADGYTVANTFTTTANETGWVKTQGDALTVTYVEYYGLHIGSYQFSSTSLSLYDGAAAYNPNTHVLSLKGIDTEDGITSELSELIVSVAGLNTVGAMKGNQAGTVVVRKDEATEADYNKLSAASVTDFETVTISEPFKRVSPVGETIDWSTATDILISDEKVYALVVMDTQVTNQNMGAVIEGVSFDGDHTLTLTDVDASSLEMPFVTNGLPQLTIHLVGDNSIACDMPLLVKSETLYTTPNVTFTTDVNASGKLVVTKSQDVETAWFEGHNTPTYANGLATNVDGNVLTIAAPSESYDLTIAGVAVTNMNAANITGDGISGSVAFDAVNNILSLNGASVTGDVNIGRESVIVNFQGSNTLSGGFTSTSSAELVLVSKNSDDQLTMGTDIPSAFTLTLRNSLKKTQSDGKYIISLPNDYGIAVNGKLITPANRTNVLEDDGVTVKYDGNSKLILTGAGLTDISMDAIELPEVDGKKVLTIHLDGSNVIENTSGKILSFTGTDAEKGDYQIALQINGNSPGSLEYKHTGTGVTLESAFDNIAVVMDKTLNVNSSTVGSVLISTALTPIIDDKGAADDPADDPDGDKEASVNFSESKASTSVLTNVVIDNILYTLNDTHEKGAEDDGFEKGKIVLNSKVSNDDMNKALQEVPGSDDYANTFKGLTFQVPSGTGTITLKQAYSESQHQICVKIGSGTPVFIQLTTEPADYTVDYSCSQATFVYIYLPESGSQAPAIMAGRRIGPKSSVAGGLGGISIQSNSLQITPSTPENYKLMEVTSLKSSMTAVVNAVNGFVCDDPDITDLPDNLFVSSSPAPRRAGGSILPEDLTFVDFSKTKITGMEVSRTSGPFNQVPENTFIYLPAGNTVAPGTRNVVIGNICDDMLLDGSEDAMPFKAMKNFKAAQATLKRTFEAGGADSKATIYLPYVIPVKHAEALGKFYAFDNIDDNTVNMTQVTGDLSANTPYIFEANGKVVNPEVKVVDVIAGSCTSANFQGVYELTTNTGEDNWYCYAASASNGAAAVGEFVKMKSGAYVPPFRAYMIGPNTGAPSLSILWDGKEEVVGNGHATAVETVKTVAVKRVGEGWWTLNGVRLNAQPKRAGMYINNGRLVVIK